MKFERKSLQTGGWIRAALAIATTLTAAACGPPPGLTREEVDQIKTYCRSHVVRDRPLDPAYQQFDTAGCVRDGINRAVARKEAPVRVVPLEGLDKPAEAAAYPPPPAPSP